MKLSMIWNKRIMPHSPTHRKTLLDIWSKGKYKTSKDLPSMRGKIIPALEFMTGATHVPKGQKADPLNLAFALPVVGKVGKVGKLAKASQYKPHILKVLEKGQKPRSVVAIQMKKGGEEWVQPFYKSTGTSVSASKKGKWFPFMGRQETADIAGKGKRFYADTNKDVARGAGAGWFIKGWGTGKDKWNLLGSSPFLRGSDPLSHAGPLKSVSKEISRLEKTGYFKHAGTATHRSQVNKWLQGYGFDRPRSMGF